MNLVTPNGVGKLQRSLHAKAKAEPNYRFYSLWDKLCRIDILTEAYNRCRKNKGAAGVDNINFTEIETDCPERWIRKLQQELMHKEYAPMPLRRVWIPKANGKMRPLGIPTIRDRVVQMAVVMILEPIFEADFAYNQYGFRPKLDAKLAIRRIFFHLKDHGRYDVIDGDLKDYFNKIPHGPLLKSVSRRIADGQLLKLIKMWLETPVIEKIEGKSKRTTENRNTHRGTPQGGVISPLLANIYFRRIIKFWEQQVIQKGKNAHIVNYADDFVICCRPGLGPSMMNIIRGAISKVGLEINEEKTKIVDVKKEQFTFLGYSFGLFYKKEGKAFIGTTPSQKAITKLLEKIHEETSVRWLTKSAENRIEELNPILRGWGNYFNQGPVTKVYAKIQKYTEKRLRRWLVKKHKQRGTGYRQYPDKYIYDKLGLYKLPAKRADLLRAKA